MLPKAKMLLTTATSNQSESMFHSLARFEI
jgi:hypothetical protein